MQLKTVGQSLNALNSMQNILNDTSLVGTRLNVALSNSLNAYSIETVKAAIAQGTFTTEQIKAILSSKGLTDAEIQEIIATNSLTASQTGATVSTIGLGTAFKGLGISVKSLGASIKAFALSNPILTAIAAIGVTVYGAVKAYDALTVSVEEANEAMSEAVGEYESAKSSLESINTELADQNKKMDELLSKDKLTYAEKGQLEELQVITKELLLQQDIEQRRVDSASKDLASKTVEAYNKQYGKHDVSREHLNETFEYSKSSGIAPIAQNKDDIIGNIAAYVYATKLLSDAQQEYETALKNGDDTKFLIDDVQNYIDAVDDYTETLDANLSDLQEKRFALENEYNSAVTKRDNGEALTSYDIDAINTYESVYDAIKLIYEYTKKNDWNNMEITSIFNTEGIEKTKEELISMYKSGELSSAEMLGQFPKLNQAIKESEIIAGESSTVYKEVFNEIAALADETADTIGSIASNTLPSLSDLLNTEDLSDTKKELLELAKSGELTPDTFTSTKQYMSLLEQTGLTAKQACDEIKKLPEFDMDLSDWQTQLQNARSNVSELKGILDDLTSKDSNGLSTSSVDKIISDYPKLLGYLNDTPRLIQEINSLISEQSDIANDAGSMIIEYSSDAYEQLKLSAQDTFNQVETMQNGQIQSVVQMYSIDLNNYTNLAQAKKAIEFALLGDLNQGWADHFGIVVDSLTGMAKATENMGEYYNNSENQKKVADYNNLIKQLNDARDRFNSNVDYGAAGVGKSKSSSKKEKDLWLEEYKRKLAELQNLLAKGRLMPSPVVIQDV